MVRNRISELFLEGNSKLRDNQEHRNLVLFTMDEVEMQLPVDIGDYTDFYASKEHATNVGSLFRDPENALLPNWLRIPIGYHGRSSSIIPSGTPIHRPYGQTKPGNDGIPEFGPSKLVDFELEMAFITTDANQLGKRVPIEKAEDYIFGLVLFNDWSARDIQAWEYVPLGPFLGKSFASTISTWIVTLDALEPFRTNGPKQDPAPLPYLKHGENKNFDIKLQVAIQPENDEETVVANSNFKYMYWSMAQQLTHHTVNGCNLRSGDMMGSGTISGPTKDSYGSMLELSWRGQNSVPLKNGKERKFIQDNDTIVMRAFAEKDGLRIGFGECNGKVLPAID